MVDQDLDTLRALAESQAVDNIIYNPYIQSRYAKEIKLQELATEITKFKDSTPNADLLLERITLEIKHLRHLR